MRIYIICPEFRLKHIALHKLDEAYIDIMKNINEDARIADNLSILDEMNSMLDLTDKEEMELRYAMIHFCDSVYLIDGWEKDNKCKMELEYAISNDKKIIKTK